jgi:8-amino-7-oxononanoate synthase
MSFVSRFQARLAAQEEQHLLREHTLISDDYDGVIQVNGQHYLNFASNDYLGLRQNQNVLQSFVEGLSKYGAGSGSASLVTGHTQEHSELSDTLATALNRDAVLLFSSGFAANQAICHALLQKGDAVVCDKLMHASFIEGALTSPATFTRFRHNDMAHAESTIGKAKQKLDPSAALLLASEGVFSMDGDQAHLPDLAALSKQHAAYLMVDDAHGFGVLGKQGLGAVEVHQLSQTDCPIVMGTFGKAAGTSGAFVAGSKDLIDYLKNSARHYIYSTAMSAANARATLESLRCIVAGAERQRLQENIHLFKTKASSKGLRLMASNTAIQPLLIGEPALAMQASAYMKKLGLWVTAIRTPTVPPGTDRLRITLSALHQPKDIEALVDALAMMRDALLNDEA